MSLLLRFLREKTEMLVPHLSWLMIIIYAEVFSHPMVQFCWVHYFHVTISKTNIDKTVVTVLCGLTPLPSEIKGPGPESLFMPWTKVLAMNLPEVELFKEQLKGTWELLHSWVPLMVNRLWMVSQPCPSTLLAALVLTDPSERFWAPWNQRTSPSGWTWLKVQLGPSLVKWLSTVPQHSARRNTWGALKHLMCKTSRLKCKTLN